MKENIDIVIISKDESLISSLEELKTALKQKIGAKTLELTTKLPEKAKKWKIKGDLTLEDTQFKFYFQKA